MRFLPHLGHSILISKNLSTLISSYFEILSKTFFAKGLLNIFFFKYFFIFNFSRQFVIETIILKSNVKIKSAIAQIIEDAKFKTTIIKILRRNVHSQKP